MPTDPIMFSLLFGSIEAMAMIVLYLIQRKLS